MTWSKKGECFDLFFRDFAFAGEGLEGVDGLEGVGGLEGEDGLEGVDGLDGVVGFDGVGGLRRRRLLRLNSAG